MSDVDSREQVQARDSGPAMFARYAYAPNALGYCGPPDPGALLGAGALRGYDEELTHLARQFEGAWPYLELIAHSNAIDDPLDRRVVEAYWIGNGLTMQVAPKALASSMDERFARRAGRHLESLAGAALSGGVAQHGFHVFAAYPWLGLLRAGNEGPPLEILDQCRIRWGRVLVVEGDFVAVSSRPLTFAGSRLVLGEERVEQVRRSLDGIGFVHDLHAGDVVSLHWDWVCDRLSETSLAWLRFCTHHNLHAVNFQAVPGPAVICNART
jgi:hypothetical protein